MTNTIPSEEVSDLISQLNHPDRFVRRAVALRLGQRKEQCAVPALIELLKDNKDVFDAGPDAALALGQIGDARAVEPLITALEDAFVTGRAVEALARLHDERAVEPLIRLYERTHIPSLATVLGNWGDHRAVEPLIAAMKDRDPHVRFYAARALGKLRDERALPALEWAKENDTDPITETKSLRRKSVSYVAARAIEAIKVGDAD